MSKHICPECNHHFQDDEVPLRIMANEINEHHLGNIHKANARGFVSDMVSKLEDPSFVASPAQSDWLTSLFNNVKDFEPKDYVPSTKESMNEQLGKAGL